MQGDQAQFEQKLRIGAPERKLWPPEVVSGSVQTVNEGVRIRTLMVLRTRFLTLILASSYYRRRKAGSIDLANGTGFTADNYIYSPKERLNANMLVSHVLEIEKCMGKAKEGIGSKRLMKKGQK
ncbi:hypothetical protein PIB30_059711 [Stylosanthes scabra]|uniref:Uncharacterized protein n=1 Tax=Stylosanthes scabra TaxID=79078 RepID=A0ABU6WIN9_9FABA|nr:hypothetical protein [Stylosanthes scabra]